MYDTKLTILLGPGALHRHTKGREHLIFWAEFPQACLSLSFCYFYKIHAFSHHLLVLEVKKKSAKSKAIKNKPYEKTYEYSVLVYAVAFHQSPEGLWGTGRAERMRRDYEDWMLASMIYVSLKMSQ